MLSYLSRRPGIGGSLKSSAGDFIVEEICEDGTVIETGKPYQRPDEPGRFACFVLQKKDWTTSSALAEIGKRVHASPGRFSSAGMKDKSAVSTQLASCEGVPKERFLDLRIKDLSILGAWTSKDKVRMGALLGNRFTLVVRGAEPGAADASKAIFDELQGSVPNYFGEQRFGSSRRNTHITGQLILQGRFEEAVMRYLSDSEGEENAEAVAARKELSEKADFRRALEYYPRHLRLERSMLAHLAAHPGDHAGALKALPRNILLLFIHAFQSHLFNERLSRRISAGMLEPARGEYFCGERLGFPDISKHEAEGWAVGKIIGHRTPLNPDEEELLASFGIAKDDFRMKAMPEIASEGTYRTLLAPLRGFSVTGAGNPATGEPEPKDPVFRFSLPAGSYATVALREFLDKEKGRISVL